MTCTLLARLIGSDADRPLALVSCCHTPHQHRTHAYAMPALAHQRRCARAGVVHTRRMVHRAIACAMLLLLCLFHSGSLPTFTAADGADTTSAATSSHTTDVSRSADDATASSSSTQAASSGTVAGSSVSAEQAATLSPADADDSAQQAEDTREIKYVIGLLKQAPVPTTPTKEGSRTVVMTAQSGARFRCVIPDPSSTVGLLDEVPLTGSASDTTIAMAGVDQKRMHSETVEASKDQTKAPISSTPVPSTATPAAATPAPTPAAAPAPAPAPVQPKPVDPAAARALEIKSLPTLFRTHLGAGCFTRQIDYWTYEVCPFKGVRQYRREADQSVTAEFLLGSYSTRGDRAVPDADAAVDKTVSGDAMPPPLVYSQQYESGTQGRRSRVIFRCHPDPAPAPNARHILTTVKETTTLQYEFEIWTTLVCRDRQGSLVAGGTGSAANGESTAADNKAGDSTSTTSSPTKTNADGTPSGVTPTPGVETGRLHSGPHRFQSGSSTTGGAAAGSAASGPHVLDLLEPLGEACTYLNTGWWTYKFCYLKEITQFHREQVAVPASSTPDGKPNSPAAPNVVSVKTGARTPQEAASNILAAAAAAQGLQTKVVVTAEFVLGMLSASTPQAELEKDATIVRGEAWSNTYVRQTYDSGTMCDLNNRPRRTETRIFCDPAETNAAVIKSVVESATCEYVVVIHTATICAHPLFKPEVPKVAEITCEPIEPRPPTHTRVAGA